MANAISWDLPETVKADSIERIGGGRTWDTGVYDTVVKMAYLQQSESGAVSLNLTLANKENKEIQERMFIRSGDKKGNKTYYTTKEGVDRPLPGYSVANSLCIAATGESLAKCMASIEKKTIKVYDHAQGNDVAKEMPVIMAVINKPVRVAIHKMKEYKRKKNEAGNYVDTADTRYFNECKFFGNTDGQTAEEIQGNKEPAFFEKWAEANKDVVIDKTKKKAKTETQSAAAIMGSPDTVEKSLFS